MMTLYLVSFTFHRTVLQGDAEFIILPLLGSYNYYQLTLSLLILLLPPCYIIILCLEFKDQDIVVPSSAAVYHKYDLSLQ